MHVDQNYRKTLESCKTWESTFDKTREQLFFGKFSVSFRTVFRKFEYQQKLIKPWENDFGLMSSKITFLQTNKIECLLQLCLLLTMDKSALCTKTLPRDKTGSQKIYPQGIKLENFTNVSINSDTNKMIFQ